MPYILCLFPCHSAFIDDDAKADRDEGATAALGAPIESKRNT